VLPPSLLLRLRTEVLDQSVIEDRMGVLDHAVILGVHDDRTVDELSGAAAVETEQADRLRPATPRVFDRFNANTRKRAMCGPIVFFARSAAIWLAVDVEPPLPTMNTEAPM
jgi:hypothetical protein